MVTGYTAVIVNQSDPDAVPFAEFVWRCARAMGVFVAFRDEAGNMPIPDKFYLDDHYVNDLRRAESKLEKLKHMPVEEAEKLIEIDQQDRAAQTEVSQKRNLVTMRRYERMHRAVELWTPPTKDHEGLKRFMLDQIREDLRWESSSKCGTTLRRPTTDEWFNRQLEDAEYRVTYARARLEEEKLRVEAANKWLDELRQSVPVPPSMQSSIRDLRL